MKLWETYEICKTALEIEGAYNGSIIVLHQLRQVHQRPFLRLSI